METTQDELKIPKRYTVLEELYRRDAEPKTWILKCLDKWSNKIIALHCIDSIIDTSFAYGLQQFCGVMIADQLQQMSDSFVKINDITYSKESKRFYINREYMDLTLAEAFRTRKFTFNDKLRIFYKLVRALSELEEAALVHLNLNPNHILLSKDLKTVKICGFIGKSSRLSNTLTATEYNRYLNTNDEGANHFRAFELLDVNSYHPMPRLRTVMDVWSLGCIFAYMLLDGISIFGNVQLDTGRVKIRLGTTSNYEPVLENGRNVYFAVPDPGKTLTILGNIWSKDKNVAPLLPLLAMMLNYDPRRRITAKTILNYKIFSEKPYSDIIAYKFILSLKMDRIVLESGEKLSELTPKRVIEYFKTLLQHKKALMTDIRNDLMYWRIIWRPKLRCHSRSGSTYLCWLILSQLRIYHSRNLNWRIGETKAQIKFNKRASLYN